MSTNNNTEQKYDILLFYSHKFGLQQFSNWYTGFGFVWTVNDNSKHKLVGTTIKFSTVEQWLMYQKAILFNDVESANKILQVNDPKIIKQLGRKVIGFEQSVWDIHKFDIAVHGLTLKFTQDSNLRKILLNTEKKILAEASPYDNIWGIGIGSNHLWANIPNRWAGQNLLGKALMEVRQKFQKEDGVDSTMPEYPYRILTLAEQKKKDAEAEQSK
jgi:ribA/ribD-fused uncharacterized protein